MSQQGSSGVIGAAYEEKPINRISRFSPTPNRASGRLRGKLVGDHPPGGAGAHDRKEGEGTGSARSQRGWLCRLSFSLKRTSQNEISDAEVGTLPSP
jgi:hypothetical protein